IFGLLLTAGILMMSCQSNKVQPPIAKKIAHRDTMFNDVRVDYYHWLRNRENPEVIDYLKAENTYTEAMMAHTKELQEKLYREMLGRIKETDVSVPVKKGPYYYYTRTEKGLQYPIHCRKKGNLEAEEEIILNENELAKGHKFFSLGVFNVSPNHRYLAYSVDTTGSETYTIYVKDLQTGQLFEEKIENTYYSLAWANDNQTFFYTVLDAAKRPYKVFRHRLGQPASKDELVRHEKDEKFFISVHRSKSGQYIFMNLASQVTSEVRFLPADRPQAAFRVFRPREYKVEYSLVHQGDYFYFLINKDAINFKLLRTPVKRIRERYWQEIIPHNPQVMLEEVEAFKNYLAVLLRDQGLRQILVKDLSSGKDHYIKFEEPLYTVNFTGNAEYDIQTLRFNYQSLITPSSIYDYNLKTRERELKKRREVPNYKPEAYQMERVWATARDGVKVPVSLIYKKGLKKDGNNPALLYGYGSYGVSINLRFNSNIFSLVDRGFVYAIGHIRGGGDLGRQWYEDGKLLKKKNTFTDFIACAQHLINEGFTSPEHLSIMGGSAGGLLMGAVTNIRPDLFKAVVAHVPFVDVLNTMLDPTLPLTVIEYDEWGNPNEEKFYWYIKSYSPYDNVTAQDYPNILVTAGLNDPRVSYWEPAKWVAKLRATKTDDNLLLLKTNMGAGHMGASGRYDYLKEVAFDYAFLLDRLSVEK
ncbi:MAG: S9 family peptidase, partial [Caldisericaceae bacterium]|nr:S9 family peptidase [Caldisericaceae bacterium]